MLAGAMLPMLAASRPRSLALGLRDFPVLVGVQCFESLRSALRELLTRHRCIVARPFIGRGPQRDLRGLRESAGRGRSQNHQENMFGFHVAPLCEQAHACTPVYTLVAMHEPDIGNNVLLHFRRIPVNAT
jgi:hypothetical protein